MRSPDQTNLEMEVQTMSHDSAGGPCSAWITPSCFIYERTSTTPQVSATRPLARRKMKISL